MAYFYPGSFLYDLPILHRGKLICQHLILSNRSRSQRFHLRHLIFSGLGERNGIVRLSLGSNGESGEITNLLNACGGLLLGGSGEVLRVYSPSCISRN
jgi:hypothetical protein